MCFHHLHKGCFIIYKDRFHIPFCIQNNVLRNKFKNQNIVGLFFFLLDFLSAWFSYFFIRLHFKNSCSKYGMIGVCVCRSARLWPTMSSGWPRTSTPSRRRRRSASWAPNCRRTRAPNASRPERLVEILFMICYCDKFYNAFSIWIWHNIMVTRNY